MAYALKYKAYKSTDDYSLRVDIRLSDDCRNGHADFAITGDFHDYKNGGNCCGCIHEVILYFFPEFKPFIDLHLCDAKGAPLYAAGNGLYHLRESSEAVTREYLRISHEEYMRLKREAEDELYMTYLLEEMGITARWQEEARAAIRQLEQLTGETFEDKSERYQFTPLSAEQRELVRTRIAEGYYLPVNIRKRKYEARLAAKRKKIADLKTHAANAKAKIEQELAVKLHVLRCGMPLDNFIYYDHQNTGVFNWMEGSCYKKVTQAEFDRFLKRVDYAKLPAGIEFQLKSA